jgi:truncated hemoglobin YjbI
MGGPPSYSDEHLQAVHAHLQIDAPTFDLMVALLGETLRDSAMPHEDADRVLAALHARRPYIVSA